MKLTSIVLLAAVGFSAFVSEPCLAQMMGNNIREMMQNMMGDRLPPEMDPALLPDRHSEGARLLERYCTQCHNLPGPGMHTANEWPELVTRMNRRMRMMSQMGMTMMGPIAAPSEQELGTITAYLEKNAQRPIAPKKYPLDSSAGKAFRATCSQCHALPEPTQHTAREWPGVVARMKGHEAVMGKNVPDDTATKEITGFLQHYGRHEN